jgi:CHAT domain-containing protein/lipopolysaccharide biosynthesis regulator YciM
MLATAAVVMTIVAFGATTAIGGPRSAASVEATYHRLFDAGNYAEALEAAQLLAPMIRASKGERSINYAVALGFIGGSLLALDRYNEAARYYLQVIAIVDALPQPNRNYSVAVRNELAGAYTELGNYQEAESIFKDAMSMLDSTVQPLTLYELFNNIGNLYRRQGRLRDAEHMMLRALKIYEKTPLSSQFAASMQNLAIIFMSEGRYGDAETLFKQSLAIRERVLGPNHKEVAQGLLNLGALMVDSEGRYQEAIPLYQRAIAIQEKILGRENDDIAMTLGNLAVAYHSAHQLPDAEKTHLEALAIRERMFGPVHPDVALSLTNLGGVYAEEDRWDEAEKAQKRAIEIWEKVSPDNPSMRIPLIGLGRTYLHQKKFDDAERMFRRALEMVRAGLGTDSPELAGIYDNLSRLAVAQDRPAEALDYTRKAAALLVSDAALAVSAGRKFAGRSTLIELNRYIFQRQVTNLAAMVRKGTLRDDEAGREAFEAAQWAGQSAAASAVAQMGVRFAAGDDALAALVRETQDLTANLADKDKALLAAQARTSDTRDPKEIDRLVREVADTQMRLAALSARLQREFPDYAALANPKPVKVDDVQKLLGADEAIVYFSLDDDASYVFALTGESFAWHTLPLGAEAISSKVAAFRQGLDVDQLEDDRVLETLGKQRHLFDLDAANDLYVALIGPVDELVRGKRHLLVVAPGPLTALPFHLLTTEKPAAAASPGDYTRYRDAAWLIKRHAVSVLPSVSSLATLRQLHREGRASKPVVGFGDPVFNPQGAAQPEPEKRRGASRRPLTRSFTDFWKGAAIDRRLLGMSLPQLPDTAIELRAVAAKLGAAAADLHLGRDATETTVKRTPLADYRVVYFATHGLVAGDVKGLAEPSLALTIPAQPNDFDDGLLTASEAAKLRLNAEWVVLSACNTIAGDKPGAEALSGLARSFFYAGARALLVSHWSVDSEAASRLTTATFDALERDPKSGRAEALRRGMLAYIADTSQPENAYPALWGAFTIIGEGAAR